MKEKRKKKEELIILPSSAFYLFIMGLAVIIIGVVCNFMVVQSNGGRMPVKTFEGGYYENYETQKHFSFSNNSEVSHWYLSDIIGIEYKEHIALFSIGDFFMFFGILLYLMGAMIDWKYQKREKIKKRIQEILNKKTEEEKNEHRNNNYKTEG